MQNQTHGLAPWVPLNSGSCDRIDTYAFRSAFGPGLVINTNIYEREPSSDFPVEWLRKMAEEQRKVSKYFYGDFYPLLSYSLNDDVWALWQYDRPDLGEGAVLAYRRQKSPFESLNAQLRELDSDAVYEITSFDSDEVKRLSGADLMEKGLPISISEKPGSAIFIYKKL